jgi:predicted dithiol-disulfide oxidoreductase (DUF899 family)
MDRASKEARRMADPLHPIRFPNESDAYREARNALLRAEIELREQRERVAAQRRQLPLGGKIREDYAFDECDARGAVVQTRLSELFAPGKDSLILYSFMYGPAMPSACPLCTSFIDGLDRYARHITQRVNLAVVAKSPLARIRAWADEREWTRVRLLSSERNTYNADYAAQTQEGNQIPACNVFVKRPDGIFHFWNAETLYVRGPGHPRHVDLLWPIWSFFDLTPEGRGDWMPSLSY